MRGSFSMWTLYAQLGEAIAWFLESVQSGDAGR